MTTFTVTPNQLKAALLFAAKKDVRYYLNGICFEVTPKHRRMIATDGHRAIIVNLGKGTAGDPAQYLIPREAVESAVKAFPKHGALDIECSKTLCSVQGITCEAIDGRFPEYERIVPRKLSGEMAIFNAHYLADMSKASSLLTGSRDIGIVHIGYNGTSASLVNLSDDAFAVIMSVRSGATPELPEWFKAAA